MALKTTRILTYVILKIEFYRMHKNHYGVGFRKKRTGTFVMREHLAKPVAFYFLSVLWSDAIIDKLLSVHLVSAVYL